MSTDETPTTATTRESTDELVEWQVVVRYRLPVVMYDGGRVRWVGGCNAPYRVRASARDLEGAARQGVARLLSETPDAHPTRVDVTLIDVRPPNAQLVAHKPGEATHAPTLWDGLTTETTAE